MEHRGPVVDVSGLVPGRAEDDALLALLVHVAFADRELAEPELDFLRRILPNRSDEQLVAWVERIGGRDLDHVAITQALDTVEKRWMGLRFGVRMAMKDGVLAEQERGLLDGLSKALDLPRHAVDTCLRQALGRGRTVAPEQAMKALRGFVWGNVEFIAGEHVGPGLSHVAPEGYQPMFGVRVDEADALAFFREGLAGRFREGVAFLAWSDIVTYTRVPMLGAVLVIHTEDGASYTLVDARFGGLAGLLDRVFETERPEPSPPPKVEMLSGRRPQPPSQPTLEMPSPEHDSE